MSRRLALTALRRVVDEFRVMEADFPASYMAVFLHIAEAEAANREHPTNTDISESVGIPTYSISRVLLSLSERRLGRNAVGEKRPQGARKALGLIERRPDPIDMRKVRWALSEKGRGLSQRISERMEQANVGKT